MSGPAAPLGTPPLLLIDAANVVGSRPTGWWQDRAGAARDLVERLRRLGEPVVVVLEGAARPGVPEGAYGPVKVVHAPGEGDDTLAALSAELGARGPVTLVTADRELAGRARRAAPTVAVAGPRRLLDRLDGLAP